MERFMISMQRLYANTTEAFYASATVHVRGKSYRRDLKRTVGGHISNPISAEPLDFVCACKME